MTVVPFAKRKTKFEQQVAGVYECLPFNSLEEGASKVSKKLGYSVPAWELSLILSRLRHIARTDPNRFGFTVPHARRGNRAPDETGPRFVLVLVSSSEEPYFDDSDRQQVMAGAKGSVGHAAAALGNEATALRLALPYYVDAW